MNFEKVWFCTNNDHYYNFTTGEVKDSSYEPPEDAIVVYCNNCKKGEFIGWYVSADKDDNLVLTAYSIDISKPIKGERIRKWTVLETYTYNKYRQIIPELSTKTARNDLSYYLINSNYNSEDYFVNAIRKVFGSEYFLRRENNFYKIDSLPTLFSFLDSKELIKKDGKKQRLIDELSALTPPAEEIPSLESYLVDSCPWKIENGFAIITAIKGYKEPCCAIRTFILASDNMHFHEGSRIYVTKKDFVIAKRRNCGDYVTAGAQQIAYWKFPMTDIESESCKGTMLEYFESIASEFIPEYRTALLFMMCKHPIIEKLYKAGYKSLAAVTVKHAWISDKNAIKETFGPINEKEKNLYKAVGANAYQLKQIDNIVENVSVGLFVANLEEGVSYEYNLRRLRTMVTNECSRRTALNLMKVVMDTDNLSSLDNESSDMLIKLVMEYNTNCYHPNLGELLRVYPLTTIMKHKDMIIDIMESNGEFRGPGYGSESLWLFRDLVHTLYLLDMKVPLNFKNYDEILAAHDQMATLYNTKQDAICMEKFGKASEKLQKYEYEGEEYCIVAPRCPDELAVEGVTLHHCVKTYIDRVANQSTGIVFIREKTDKTKPFYTVEVQKDFIQQIHGMCNCNVEKGSSLERFIKEWVETKNLSMTNINKIR